MSYRELRPQPQVEADFDEFLETLHRALTDGKRDPNEVVQTVFLEPAAPLTMYSYPPPGMSSLMTVGSPNSSPHSGDKRSTPVAWR